MNKKIGPRWSSRIVGHTIYLLFQHGKKIGWDSILVSKLRSFYVFLILLAAVFLLFFHISIYCLPKAREDGGMEGWRDGGMDGCQLFTGKGMISPVIVAYSAMMSEGIGILEGSEGQRDLLQWFWGCTVEDSFDRYPWSFWVVNKHCEPRGIGWLECSMERSQNKDLKQPWPSTCCQKRMCCWSYHVLSRNDEVAASVALIPALADVSMLSLAIQSHASFAHFSLLPGMWGV